MGGKAPSRLRIGPRSVWQKHYEKPSFWRSRWCRCGPRFSPSPTTADLPIRRNAARRWVGLGRGHSRYLRPHTGGGYCGFDVEHMEGGIYSLGSRGLHFCVSPDLLGSVVGYTRGGARAWGCIKEYFRTTTEHRPSPGTSRSAARARPRSPQYVFCWLAGLHREALSPAELPRQPVSYRAGFPLGQLPVPKPAPRNARRIPRKNWLLAAVTAVEGLLAL